MDSQQVDLHPPKNWQDLQDLCHALWEAEWQCPSIQKNGRTGQQQRGVDIFGQPKGGSHYHGIQCKVKSADAAKNPELTESEVLDEVNQAKKFSPVLESLIIATTAPEDAKIQAAARRITQDHTKQGLFRVDVIAWPEIVARLAKHQEILERFYPHASANWKQMAMQVGETHERTEAIDHTLGQILAIVSQRDTDTAGIAAIINKQIDHCRELLEQHQPQTAIRLLEAIKKDHAPLINDKAQFRIITNIGAAKLHLNDVEGAANAFLEAWGYAQDDPKADGNRAFALYLLGRYEEARTFAIEARTRHPQSGKLISILLACAIAEKTLADPLTLGSGLITSSRL